VSERSQQIALVEPDTRGQAQPPAVLGGDGHGRGRDVYRVDDGVGPLRGQRQRDAPTARAHVHHYGRLAAAQQIEGGFDQHLCLRPGDEHVWRHEELVTPEGLRAGQVLQGPPEGALRHERQE
jgi:hypothetical protein